jgi:hypothetical protein
MPPSLQTTKRNSSLLIIHNVALPLWWSHLKNTRRPYCGVIKVALNISNAHRTVALASWTVTGILLLTQQRSFPRLKMMHGYCNLSFRKLCWRSINRRSGGYAHSERLWDKFWKLTGIFWTSNVRKKLMKSYIWNIALYGAENWTLQKIHQKYIESFDMLCWERMEKISWIDCVRNKVLHGFREERNTLHEIKKREGKLNWSHLAYELPPKIRYWRKHIREQTTKKKT